MMKSFWTSINHGRRGLPQEEHEDWYYENIEDQGCGCPCCSDMFDSDEEFWDYDGGGY
jgi:hypothetical protein